MGELATINTCDSVGWHDLHAGRRPTDGHQTSSNWLRLSHRHCHGTHGKLTWETLAAGTQHTGGTTAQPTRLWELHL